MPASHAINLETAIDMTSLYRDEKNNVLQSAYDFVLPLSETFDRNALDDLLALDDCSAIRIYYGMKNDLSIHAILVGVNSRNEDLIPGEVQGAQIMEDAQRCPDDCPPSSPLNED